MIGTPARRGRRTPMAEINVTPLVDVMLVLLIIFMVTAPLLVTGVPVDLPDAHAAALKTDDTPVQVSLDRAGAVFIGEEKIADDALAPRLAALRASKDEATRVFVRADRGLDYGRVMTVVGEVSAAGFHKVALVSAPAGTAAGAKRR